MLLIIVIALILRIYNIDALFYFSYDEEIPALVGRNFLLDGKLPLIGGVTPFGVHLPPYFYWLLAFIVSLGKLNPIWWGVASAMFSTLTVLLIHLVGKELINKKVGIFSAILWTFSYTANVYDRHLWALYWGPMLCLATLYSLKKITEGNKRYVFLLSLTIIWSIATDPSNAVFVITSVLAYAAYKIRISKLEIIGIATVILSLLPLVVFDMRHNFANSKPFLQYLRADKSSSRFISQDFFDRSAIFTNSFIRLIYPFSDNEIAKQYSYCPSFIFDKYEKIPDFLKIIAAIALLSFVLFAIKSKNQIIKLAFFVLTLYFIGIQLYGKIFNGDIFEHYLTGLFPIFILIISYCLSYLPKKIVIIFLSLFMIANLYKLSTTKNSHGLSYKREAIQYTSTQLDQNDFSLESLSTCWRYSGYRYLFAVFGREPSKSYVDPNFSHLYGKTPIAQTHPQTVVTFVTHDFTEETAGFYEKYALYKSHEVTGAVFGNIEVIIMDNSRNWF